ncbi:MAG: DUF1640 domain-containing protein [Nitrospirae bacterium]|nr:DUF1640 domain-containing protein [Nitrospirota bacterium]
MAVITIPDVLRERLGEKATMAFVDVIKEVDSESKKDLPTKTDLLATKAELKEDIYKVNERITIEIGKINERITEEVGKINERITIEAAKTNERITEEIGKLRNDYEKTSKEHIKWMFLFWIGQITFMTGFITVILKYFIK